MKRRAVFESVIGEDRAAVYEGRKLVELHVRRWSDVAFPKIYERWTGRIASIDPSLGGAFVTLGEGPDGLLPFKASKDLPRLTEGLLVDVVIAKQAIAEKGPVLRYEGEASLDAPGRVEQIDLKAMLTRRFDGISIEDAPVGVVDTACERQIAIKGGGQITIDRTQALVAIDIDKGSAPRTFEAAMAAAKLTMSELRLRGLGGLVVIDFPNLRQPKQRTAILREMERMVEPDPASVRLAPFSRFGVVEMTRGQDGPSLDAILLDRFGQPTAQTRAIRALRRLTREAAAAPGAKLTLMTPMADLESLAFDWRAAVTKRIGGRFAVEDTIDTDVKADR